MAFIYTAIAQPPLTLGEERIIIHKGTERPFSGTYTEENRAGVYYCRQCGAPLFTSEQKFPSSCGWPSFDDALPGAVTMHQDVDGIRTEIVCAQCNGHLGHVFIGEGFTEKNTRHCVNSVSMTFVPAEAASTEIAIFAGGCFWGVEHFFSNTPGVVAVESGYTGGVTEAPSYEDVCSGATGHAEAVRVTFDPSRASYEALARSFFEIHDPGQLNRQGPDVGTQYRSAVFYLDEKQRDIAERLILLLIKNGYEVVTEVIPATEFYPAEEYHQHFFSKHADRAPCHWPVKRFDEPASYNPYAPFAEVW